MSQPFFSLSVYADDSKSSLLATVTNIVSVQRTLPLMAPSQHSITIPLTDRAGSGLNKGNYYELLIGKTSPRQLWASGYIQKLSIDPAGSGYLLEGLSALKYLDDFRDLGHLDMNPHIFGNVVDVLNGVQNPAGSGIYPPGYKGILTGTGFFAVWTDPNGTAAPGAGDYWRTDWATPMANLLALAQHYNFYIRERAGALAHNAVLEIGPLNDPMFPGSNPDTLTIWGGDNLRSDLASNHPELAALSWPNAAYAQQYGYAQIEEASWSDDMAQVINLVWPIGRGNPDSAGGVTLKKLVGGDPPGNGWSSWQPYSGGRLYYLKAASRVTYQGNSYEFVASQRQDARWAYGVVNRGPSPGTGPPPYGVNEYVLVDKKILDPSALLAAALGRIEYAGDPVPSFTFQVRHPLLSTDGVPVCPAPGNRINVNYSGLVRSIALDGSTSSATYGQYIANGNYTYLNYPNGPAGATASPQLQAKLKRIIQIDDAWENGQYTQLLTTGRGRWTSKYWASELARRMEHQQQKPGVGRGQAARKQLWHNVELSFSNSPYAYEDAANNSLVLTPGAFIVSDVPDSNFFDQGHSVTFTATAGDANQALDFWFCKVIDGSLAGVSSNAPYGVFRLAFSNSGLRSGFFTTQDGTTFTGRGQSFKRETLWDLNRRIATVASYRVTVSWKKNVFTALVEFGDITMPSGATDIERVAVWTNVNPQVITTWGAIGWHLIGGSANGTITGLHAQAYHPQRSKHGTNRRQISQSQSLAKQRQNPGGGTSIWAFPGLPKPV